MSGRYFIIDEKGKKHGEYSNLNYARAMAMDEIIASANEEPVEVWSIGTKMSKTAPFFEGIVIKKGKTFKWSTSKNLYMEDRMYSSLNKDGSFRKTKSEQMHPFGL